MSAVWVAARAAVRRRPVQTVVLAVVVLLSTTMIVVALGFLVASSGPFDQGYARQSGAHLVGAFDRTKVSDDELARAARQPEVAAVAGPFGQVTAAVQVEDGPALDLAVVGRADPDGPVDRLDVWKGRWATGNDEVVLAQNPVADPPGEVPYRIGAKLALRDGPTLIVVGFASSVSGSAEAWVTPARLAGLHPTTTQMLYRFTRSATDADVAAGRRAVTTGVPSGALVGSRSYLTLKASVVAEAATVAAFLITFGVISLAVAVLIVANVVSGAVVSGYRHIGVLKALGFSPAQVLAVYLVMVSVPAVVGCVLGTVLGNVLARPLLTYAFRSFGAGEVGVSPWVDVATLLGMPVVVALSALVPALRARRLPAVEAISAGSAQRDGRGLRVQRRLSGTRLPRAVSLGLGLPFARPARSAMTLAAVALGIASVTLAAGLGRSLTTYDTADRRADAVQVEVQAHRPPPEAGAAPPGSRPVPTLGDAGDEAMLRALPGTAHVTASTLVEARRVGVPETVGVRFYRGDSARLGYQVLAGHWLDGPGQIVVSERFLQQQGLAVGDTVTLEVDGRRAPVRIVGKVLMSTSQFVLSNWETLAVLAPGQEADTYEVGLRPGTDRNAYLSAVEAGDPTLSAEPPEGQDEFVVIVLATVSLLTLMLGVLAGLGVFNTVILNTRERRRDLAMLKSIGMTPRQVTIMVVTSMAALGAVGGLLGVPIGIAVHRVVLPAMARAAQTAFPDSMLHVFAAPTLVLLVLAGVAIAAAGAFIPARSAARSPIAEVLQTE